MFGLVSPRVGGCWSWFVLGLVCPGISECRGWCALGSVGARIVGCWSWCALGFTCPGISECWGRYALGLVGAGVCVPQGWWAPCHAVGDVVPQWCQWCGWTRAALRVPTCHGMRHCGGRNFQIWRQPSSCLTASSDPLRTGVSLGHSGDRGQGWGLTCIHGAGRAWGTPHLAMGT